MPRTSGRFTAIVAVITALLCGYVLVTTPGLVVQQYQSAQQAGPVVAYFYIAAVSLGGLLMLSAAGYVGMKLIGAMIRSARMGKPRPLSELSDSQKKRRLDQDVSAVKELARQPGIAPTDRDHLTQEISELEHKHRNQTLEIAAFGTISSGKSSLLNALAGRDVFGTDVRGGTTTSRNDVSCAALGNVALVDTPGLGEVRGADRAAIARQSARNADIVLFVIDGPLKDFEFETLEALSQMGKRLLVCLNKADWYSPAEQVALMSQIHEQTTRLVAADDVLTVRSTQATRVRIRELATGGQEEISIDISADISPLAKRMLGIIRHEGKELLLANLLLRSRGLVDDAHERVRALLDGKASILVDRYTWQTAAIAAITPIPLLDAAAAGGMITKMVSDLADVYGQPLDMEAIKTLLSKLMKNLAAIGGTTAIASLLKAVPGFGTLAGGALQGIVQAVVTRWVGKTFMTYFRAGMKLDLPSLEDEARRQWDDVTAVASLADLAAKALRFVGSSRRGER